MKGHTKIELTDVKTGKVQVIEDDNIVTDYFRKLLTPHYPFVWTWNDTIDIGTVGVDPNNKNAVNTPFDDFAGLIMFKEQLDADPSNYRPNGTMTAHADKNIYIGPDLTRGSFNKNLSSYSFDYSSGGGETKVVMVWDFGLEQGNGTIGTVCLCNPMDAKIGYGSNYVVPSTVEELGFFFHHSELPRVEPVFRIQEDFALETDGKINGSLPSADITMNLHPIYLNTEHGRVVCMDVNFIYNDCIRLIEIDTNGTSVQPINRRVMRSTSKVDAYYSSSTFSNHRLTKFTKCQTHYLPLDSVERYTSTTRPTAYDANFANPVSCYDFMCGLDGNGNLWYVKNAGFYMNDPGWAYSTTAPEAMRFNWKKNETIKLCRVNLKTFETTDFVVTNTTGDDYITVGACSSGYSSYGYLPGFLANITVVKDYFVFHHSNGHYYAINLLNNSDVKEFKYADSNEPVVLANSNGTYVEGSGSSTKRYRTYASMRGHFSFVEPNHIYFCKDGILSEKTTQLFIVDTDTFEVRYVNCVAHVSSPRDIDVKSVSSSGYVLIGDSDCEQVLYPVLNAYSGVWTDERKCMVHELAWMQWWKPTGLITINTLAEPVTKTADMTMRITYTLTA